LHAASLGLPALVVTGSHIPFDRNGIKFYRAEGEISKADEETMLKAIVKLPAEINIAPLPAIDLTAREAYVRRYVNYYGVGALAGIRLAVYEHSSVARDVLREILEALGATVISLGRTDTFVPIDTEAVRPEDVVQARCWAAEHQFDAVLSTDGDADRPLLGDESGTWLRGDVVGILCARYLQADTVVTPVSSNTALEKSGWFKSVARTRIGSPYVIAGMANGKGVVVGYEANGGFLLGTDVERGGRKLSALPTRDAILPMVSLLSMARERRSRLSDLLDDLPQRFTASDRLQEFPTEHSQELLVRLQVDTDYAAALLAPASGGIVAVDTTDGFRASFANGDIVHLRPSGNAPELRCYAESDLQQQAESLCATCLAGIPRN
jgi:phosphomannomutase